MDTRTHVYLVAVFGRRATALHLERDHAEELPKISVDAVAAMIVEARAHGLPAEIDFFRHLLAHSLRLAEEFEDAMNEVNRIASLSVHEVSALATEVAKLGEGKEEK